MLDETVSNVVHKDKKVIDRGKRSKTLSEVKPVENKSKNLDSFLEISTMQKKVLPSHKPQDHAYEQQNPFGLKEDNPSQGLISSFLSNRRLRVVLDGKSSQEYPVNAGAPQGSILGATLFLLYINDLPDVAICTIAIYADDTTLYSKRNQASDLWQQLELASELESDLRDTVNWGRKWLVDFNAGKTQLVSSDRSKNTGAIDVKMDGSALEEKTSFKMLGLTFSSKLDWGPYIVSIAKTASKKIGALIRSMKFLSPEVAPYLYKSTIRPCMQYCCHVWAGAPSCYLELLDKLQKRICRTVGPSLAASLEPLAHRRNVASLSLFYRYYFGRCSSELAQLVPLPYSRGRSTRYSDRLHDFSVTIPRCYKDVYVNSFFPRTARLWNL